MSDQDQPIIFDNESEIENDKNNLTFKIAFFITLPVFMAYACCFSLQHRLSFVFGLTEGVSGDKKSIIYGIGTSFVYFFNLLFRVLGHNILMGCFNPKDRVTISLISMIIGMIMLSFLSFANEPPNLIWVFISYAFCGVCEGSYGPNILNVVNQLGHTRLYVVLAMPVGVATITILGFGLMALGFPFQYFYIITAILLFIAIIIYYKTIYPQIGYSNIHSFNLTDFFNDFKEINQWFSKIWFHSLIFLINMICLALFNPGCTLYVYQKRVTFRLLGFTINHDWFIFFYNIGSFLGDFLSRRIMDKKKILNPIYFFLLLCFGFIINVSLIPEIAPFAAFAFSWANGGLYTQSTKLIGDLFKEKYHLTSTSSWLFIGDVGSTSGANLVQFLRPQMAKIKSLMY